jgi:hypothetical protein
MKIFFTLLLLSNIAIASTIDCSVKVNYQTIASTSIDLTKTNKAVIAKLDGKAFYLSSTKDIYSIEYYDQDTTSRMYASGVINQENGINFVSWNRESILEVHCQM